MISELAHVDPTAKIGKNVTIHPFAFISKNVEIGDNCTIYPYVSILTGARIGNNNKIYNGSIIAAEPQDLRWKGNPSFCYIGNNNIIREHSIVNRGIYETGGTRIGDNCFISAEAHISHDAEIGDHAVLGNGAQVSGCSKLGPHCILSSNVIVNFASELGQWVTIKGGCRVSGFVPPYIILAHNPAQYFGVNAQVMRFKGFKEDVIDEIAKAYRHVYQCGISVFNAVKRIESDVKPLPERDNIVSFIKDHKMNIVAIPNMLYSD